jgi:hypothetical protein
MLNPIQDFKQFLVLEKRRNQWVAAHYEHEYLEQERRVALRFYAGLGTWGVGLAIIGAVLADLALGRLGLATISIPGVLAVAFWGSYFFMRIFMPRWWLE